MRYKRVANSLFILNAIVPMKLLFDIKADWSEDGGSMYSSWMNTLSCHFGFRIWPRKIMLNGCYYSVAGPLWWRGRLVLRSVDVSAFAVVRRYQIALCSAIHVLVLRWCTSWKIRS